MADVRWLIGVVTLSAFLAISGRCSAQSLNLPPDSSVAVFENGGHLSVGGSSIINGNVDVSVGSLDPSIQDSTINGNLNSHLNLDINDPNRSLINSIVTGAINPGVSASFTGLPTTTTPGAIPNYTGDGDYTINGGDSAVTFTGSSGINVFNIHGDFTVQDNTINLVSMPGASNEMFIFNIYSTSGSGLAFENVKMTLGTGISASNVIFNVVDGDASIGVDPNSGLGSTVYGTFYTAGGPDGGRVSITNSTLNGSLVAGGGNDIAIENSIITAQPFFTAAPEMPTIVTAGAGMFLLVASSYWNHLKRKHQADPGRIAA